MRRGCWACRTSGSISSQRQSRRSPDTAAQTFIRAISSWPSTLGMIAPRRRFPICNPQRLEALFRDAGLAHVESRGIDVRTRFENFDDYCSPVIRAMNVAFRLRGQEFCAAIRARVRADRARRRPPAVVLPERRSSLARRDLPPSATATVARLGNPGRVGLCTPSVTGADHFKAGFSARWRRRTTQTALPSRPPTLIALATRSVFAGDAPGGYHMFCQAAEIGDRFGDRDLIALARHSRGRVLIRMGEIRDGVRLLDEAMIAVDAGEVSPLVVGDVYCSVIEGCLEIFDLRRAQEWTAALTRWCESQPDLVPYRGQCLVRRAEILQLHGAWPDAIEAARQACERLLHPSPQPALGAAFCQCGELHRLRGEFTEADEAYRNANRYGRKPQPGLALLRLAQGHAETATTAIRLALVEAHGTEARSRLLPAYVEIMLAAGDIQ